jgi:hypothetical protein
LRTAYPALSDLTVNEEILAASVTGSTTPTEMPLVLEN